MSDFYDGSYEWEDRYHDGEDVMRSPGKWTPAAFDNLMGELSVAYIKKNGINSYWYKCDKPLKDMDEKHLRNILIFLEARYESKKNLAWIEAINEAIDYKAMHTFD